MQSCELIDKKEEKIACLFSNLNTVTSEQDVINIDLMKTLNNDQDPRWIPIHMIDNANAIILGISRNRGRPDLFVPEGYVGEKIDALDGKWWMVKRWRQ